MLTKGEKTKHTKVAIIGCNENFVGAPSSAKDKSESIGENVHSMMGR
jgi:hypothetical protein